MNKIDKQCFDCGRYPCHCGIDATAIGGKTCFDCAAYPCQCNMYDIEDDDFDWI